MVDKMEYFQSLISDIDYQGLAIIGLSLVCYIGSLYLPAIAKYNPPLNNHQGYIKYDKGAIILLMGLVFGWFVALMRNIGAIAVYANLIYYHLVINLLFVDKKPSQFTVFLAILMLLLMMLSFIYKEPSGGEIAHTRFIHRVTLWCYGAFLWFFALGSLASIVFFKYWLGSLPSVLNYLVVFIIYFSIILAFQYYKYRYLANELERQYYFSKWIMLTTKKMSGLPYINPTQQNINITESTVIALRDELNFEYYRLLNRYRYSPAYRRYFATPMQFQYKGYFWRVLTVPNKYFLRIAEISQSKEVDYYYTVNTLDNKLDYRIFDSHQQLIWKARSQIFEKDSFYYFPNYSDDLYELFSPLRTEKPLEDETLKEKFVNYTYHKCPIEYANLVGNNIKIGDKIFHLGEYNAKNFIQWQSDEYILLVNNDKKVKKPLILIFQKHPVIKPIGSYYWLHDVLEMQPDTFVFKIEDIE